MSVRTVFSHSAILAVVVANGGCEGQPARSGIGEPVQIVGGQFIAGDLPGAPPPINPDADGGMPTGAQITTVSLNSVLVALGMAGKSISGRSSGAVSVGVRFADMGTGYWVVPGAEADPQFPGENAFRFSANFDPADPPGLHKLRFVGFDGSGRAGTQAETSLCLVGRIPDNLHSCLPNVPPPAAVITLQWDTNFDVDLHVVTPDGSDINPKSPLVERLEAGAAPSPKASRIDRDSMGGCIADGLRQEDLIFQDSPRSGTYRIYADPFASCGQSAVHFKLTVYRVAGGCPGCLLEPQVTQSGELLASQATGGASTGLSIYNFTF